MTHAVRLNQFTVNDSSFFIMSNSEYYSCLRMLCTESGVGVLIINDEVVRNSSKVSAVKRYDR